MIGTIVGVYGRVAYSLVALIICVVMSLLCSLCVVVLFHIFGRRHAEHYIEIIHDSREWYMVMVITATQDITHHYFSHGFWGMGPLSICTMILLQMYIAMVYARRGVAIQVLSELRIGLLGLIGCHLLWLLTDLAFHRGRALVYFVICEVVFFTLLILDRALIEMVTSCPLVDLHTVLFGGRQRLSVVVAIGVSCDEGWWSAMVKLVVRWGKEIQILYLGGGEE